jgi:hypothetical protein
LEASAQTRVALVGRESLENLRLAEVLRGLVGDGNVFRHLETQHLLSFLAEHAERPIVIFFDVFSFNLQEVTQVIGQVRNRYPRVVFSLYVDPDVWRTRRSELPADWSTRLDHYYRLYKVPNDEEFDPIVRQALKAATWEAHYNFGHEPIRLTKFDAGILTPDPSLQVPLLGKEPVFVSYSRSDWDDVVSDLVEQLRQGGFQFWVDQGFLVGGEDWLDTIGEALEKCSVCLLMMSPKALQSKYVKMEWRFFFHREKPIVPVKVKPGAELPPELSGIQYVDLTVSNASNYDHLRQALARYAEA